MSTKKKPASKEQQASTVPVPRDIEERRIRIEAALWELNEAIDERSLDDQEHDSPVVFVWQTEDGDECQIHFWRLTAR